jgi:hypothetical protein
MPPPPIDPDDMYLIVGRLTLDHHMNIREFTQKYLGELSVAEILQLDPGLSRYLEARTPADLQKFRQGSFARRTGVMPPVVLVTLPRNGEPHTELFEGRGRVNWANAHRRKLHVWHLVYRNT